MKGPPPAPRGGDGGNLDGYQSEVLGATWQLKKTNIDQKLQTLQDVTDMASSPAKNTLSDIGVGLQGVAGRIETDIESP